MGWLSDRLESRTVLPPAMLLMAAALAWLPQARSLGSLLLVSLCLHAGFAAWGMPSAALAILTQGAHLARTLACYRLLVDGAATLAPWLVGMVIEHYGYGLPAWCTAAVVALTAILVAGGLHAGKTERGVTL
jgi:predicted MFS family arabinose efflux permease